MACIIVRRELHRRGWQHVGHASCFHDQSDLPITDCPTPEPQLKDIVHEIAVATKSQELLQQMLEELKGLRENFDQDSAERALREGPYSGVYRFAPAKKAEWYGFLGFIAGLLAIILPIILNRPEPPTIIIQSHDQEIVQQLKEINERLADDDPRADAHKVAKPKKQP